MKATHQLDVTISMREIDSVEAVTLLKSGDIDLAFAGLEGDLGSGIESMPLNVKTIWPSRCPNRIR